MTENIVTYRPFPVSWEEIHRHSKALAWRLREKGHWEGIVAITRGGLVPATVIARELDIRVVETVCVSSYDHQKQREVELLKPAMQKIGAGKGWIVVDDLADTGRTLELMKKLLPEAHYACVYVKPQGKPLVDSFVIEVSQDTWIFLPWEDENK
jgi:xanthine phosphoribosyltransferase